LTDEVAALKASLQFMQQEQDDIKHHVATCEKKTKSGQGRRWNLLLFRIKETEGENCHHIVKDVLKNNLQIPDQCVDIMPLCGVHWLGKKNTTNGTDQSFSDSPGGQTGTPFRGGAVFLQSLISEWGKTLSTTTKTE